MWAGYVEKVKNFQSKLIVVYIEKGLKLDANDFKNITNFVDIV